VTSRRGSSVRTSLTRNRELGMTEPSMAGDLKKLSANRNRRDEAGVRSTVVCDFDIPDHPGVFSLYS
jgi:hypothetical protein